MSDSIEKRNYEAVCQTLAHHGKIMEELDHRMQALSTQVVGLGQELEQQRGLIVRSLQQKYGNGSTSGE